MNEVKPTIKKTMELGNGYYEYDEEENASKYVPIVRIIDNFPDYSKCTVDNSEIK